MKTGKKWLVFWGVLLAMVIGLLAVVFTGNFPQFEIPFSWFASEDKATQKTELPKLTAIALKDYSDQELLTQQLNQVETMNTKLADEANYASSESLESTLASVFGTVTESKEVYNLYRAIYPVISANESSFVQVSLLGFGVQLKNNQPVTKHEELWTFTDTASQRHDYQVTLVYNQKKLLSSSIKTASDNLTVLTSDDTYLDQAADFETTWDDIVTNLSDEQIYTQLKKEDFNQQSPEYTALENDFPAKDKTGFFELFKATQGNLRHAYLAGFFHSNSPTDGETAYMFRVPTSKDKISYFVVNYDRLQKKIINVEQQ